MRFLPCVDPITMDKQGIKPPSELCTFNDVGLAARLNRVAIFPEDCDFYSKLDGASRTERLARARYQVIHLICLLDILLLYLCQ